LTVKTRRFWGLITQKTTFLFLAAAVISVFVLIWMGLRLMKQDRTLEVQQIEDKRETAADRFVAALEQVLLNEERKLTNPQAANVSPNEDFVRIFMNSEGIRVQPEKTLLFYPVVPSGNEAPSELFINAERAEFQNNNYNRAITLLRPLSNSRDPNKAAAAKLRLARNLRKAGRLGDALDIYKKLNNSSSNSQVTISGVPADLVARRALCALLEKMGSLDQLKI